MSTIGITRHYVIEALEDTLSRPLEAVTNETALFQDVGLDSTSVLDLLMNLEDKTVLEIDTEDLELEDFQTVGSLVSFVSSISK